MKNKKQKKNTNDDIIDDVVYDEEVSADPTKKLRDRLKTCVEEKQEYLDGWQRAKADFFRILYHSCAFRKEFEVGIGLFANALIHEVILKKGSSIMRGFNSFVFTPFASKH